MSKYIPVEQQLPEPGIDLVATDGFFTEVGFYSFKDQKDHARGFDKDCWCDFHFKVRGWIALPDNPWREKDDKEP